MVQLGILYGISVGPGDPELITLKALRLLKSVPVVAFPKGINHQPGIAQQIIDQWLTPEQVQLPLIFPYVQDDSILEAAWQQAALQIWPYLHQGQNVAFACEGDISFYSTFTYLAQTLQKLFPQVQIQTIPGVASPMAVASALGIPLTIRNQKLAILPAVYNIEELEIALIWADVVVLMKVSSVYEQVWSVLEKHGLLDQSWVVERASTPLQIIYSGLRDRPNLKLPYFSLLMIQLNHPLKNI